LLRYLEHSSVPSWAVGALVATYDDPEVQQSLRAQALDAEPARSQQLAELIPDIVDPGEAADRLVALASDPAVTRLDRVTLGLASLARNSDVEVNATIEHTIDVIVDREAAENPDRRRTSAEFALFAHFSHVQSVRDLALRRLGEGDVPLQALVFGFRDDVEIRTALVPRLFPLPAMLRARLTQVLTDVPLSDGDVTRLLDGFDADADDTVKLLGAVGIATRARRSRVGIDELIERFVAMVKALGHDHDERRRAGFAGLATLGVVDRIVDLREQLRPDDPVRIQTSLIDRGGTFDRLLAANWDTIREAFGESAEERLSRYGAGSFWQGLFGVAADYAPLRAEALKRIDLEPVTPRRGDLDSWAGATAEAQFLARVEPGGERLKTRCIKIVESGIGPSYAETRPFWQAVEILAAQFLDDPAVRGWLEAHLDQERSRLAQAREAMPGPVRPRHLDPVVVAACRLCPEDERLHQLATLIDTADGLSIDEVELLFAVSGPDAFLQLVDRIARYLAWSGWFADLLIRPAVARLVADDPLAARVEAHLLAPDDRPQGTLIRLLTAAGRFLPGSDFIETRRTHLWQRAPRLMSYDPLTGEMRGEDLIWRDLAP
jgi:hypothetical protein